MAAAAQREPVKAYQSGQQTAAERAAELADGRQSKARDDRVAKARRGGKAPGLAELDRAVMLHVLGFLSPGSLLDQFPLICKRLSRTGWHFDVMADEAMRVYSTGRTYGLYHSMVRLIQSNCRDSRYVLEDILERAQRGLGGSGWFDHSQKGLARSTRLAEAARRFSKLVVACRVIPIMFTEAEGSRAAGQALLSLPASHTTADSIDAARRAGWLALRQTGKRRALTGEECRDIMDRFGAIADTARYTLQPEYERTAPHWTCLGFSMELQSNEVGHNLELVRAEGEKLLKTNGMEDILAHIIKWGVTRLGECF